MSELKSYIFENGNEPEGWEERYIDFLNFLKENKEMLLSGWGEYVDPDQKYNLETKTHRPEFYEELRKFLTAQEKGNILDKDKDGYIEYTYGLADKEDNPEEPVYYDSKKYKKNPGKYVYGISVTRDKENRPFTYLKSDQFGFSAPRIELNHIYDVYLVEKNGEAEKVAKWIKKTRTLGGSFLWPMERDAKGKFNQNPEINKLRGGKKHCKDSSMQDRVDLTLKEIKTYYINRKAGKKDGKIIKYKWKNLEEWLDHFGDFPTYVDFFKFNDFVDSEYEIKSICDRKNIYDNDISKSEIEEMMDDLCDRIEKRSEAMEDVINGQSKK